MAAEIIDLRRGRGRPSPEALVTANDHLRAEVHAMRTERNDLATEVSALSRRIQYAIAADRPDVALHVAGRLDALAASLDRRGAA